MNNTIHKKEYSEQDIEKILSETHTEIKPSNVFVNKLLESLPVQRIPSPYAAGTRSFFTIKKLSFVMAAFVLVILGGITYIHHLTLSQNLPSELNDTSINTEISNIDTQMNLLSTDDPAIDQSVH